MSSTIVAPFTATNRSRVASLYKRALKLSRDWAVQRDTWRIEVMHIRKRFEENRHVTNPRLLENLLSKAQEELTEFKHPDPYIVPTAPGGSKVRRCRLPRLSSVYADPVCSGREIQSQ